MKREILAALLFAISMGGIAQAQTAPTPISQTSSAQHIVASGTWTKKKYKSRGTWKITTQNGVTTASLDDQFKTKRAPDLTLLLSPHNIEQVNGKNAIQGAALISVLESHKGAQSYVIPANIDISQYKTILIHCEDYAKLWSAANL